TSISGPTLTVSPVSSRTSRTIVSVNCSPRLANPPGNPHCLSSGQSRCRSSSSRPSSARTTPVTPTLNVGCSTQASQPCRGPASRHARANSSSIGPTVGQPGTRRPVVLARYTLAGEARDRCGTVRRAGRSAGTGRLGGGGGGTWLGRLLRLGSHRVPPASAGRGRPVGGARGGGVRHQPSADRADGDAAVAQARAQAGPGDGDPGPAELGPPHPRGRPRQRQERQVRTVRRGRRPARAGPAARRGPGRADQVLGRGVPAGPGPAAQDPGLGGGRG